MEHKDQPTFKIPNVVKQYATDILLKYPDITITQMEKFLRNKFQLDLTKDQIRYAAYQLMLKPNGESLMKENEKINDKNSYIRDIQDIVSKIRNVGHSIANKNGDVWVDKVLEDLSVAEQKLYHSIDFIRSLREQINSKGYYASIIEQKNANTWFKGHTPEDDAKRLTALEPIVKSLKRKGMSPKDIAIELEKKTRPELARQAVQAFYD